VNSTVVSQVLKLVPRHEFQALRGYREGQSLRRISRESHSSRHRFRFKNPLYFPGASLIELSLATFPWADHNRSKAAMKLQGGWTTVLGHRRS